MTAASLSAIFLSGCASLVTSDNIGYPIHSKPEGAQVRVVENDSKNAALVCVTPCHLTLRQDHGYQVTVRKSGYVTQHIKVRSETSVEGVSGSLAGNLLAEGIFAPIGMVTDAASGADDRLFPGHLDVKLKPNTSPEKNVATVPSLTKTKSTASLTSATATTASAVGKGSS